MLGIIGLVALLSVLGVSLAITIQKEKGPEKRGSRVRWAGSLRVGKMAAKGWTLGWGLLVSLLSQ